MIADETKTEIKQGGVCMPILGVALIGVSCVIDGVIQFTKMLQLLGH